MPVRRDRQDRGSLRRARNHPRRAHDERRRTAWTRSSARSTTTRRGLIFANLVDFDTVYGHRNDPAGYAANLERFDARLARSPAAARPRDLLIVTADHGNDPTTPSTDHSREHVPLFVVRAGRAARASISGCAQTFADLGPDDRRSVRRRSAGARHELSRATDPIA